MYEIAAALMTVLFWYFSQWAYLAVIFRFQKVSGEEAGDRPLRAV